MREAKVVPKNRKEVQNCALAGKDHQAAVADQQREKYSCGGLEDRCGL
jgi:hypothetical protein